MFHGVSLIVPRKNFDWSGFETESDESMYISIHRTDLCEWQQLAKCLCGCVCASLVVCCALSCPRTRELAHNLQGLVGWDCLFCCLSCSLRLVWEYIPALFFSLRFGNKMSTDGISEVVSSFACLFVSSAARLTWIALSVKSGSLSWYSLRRNSLRSIIKISFTKE